MEQIKRFMYMLARINQRQSHLVAPIVVVIITILFVASAPTSCINHTANRMKLEREDHVLRHHQDELRASGDGVPTGMENGFEVQAAAER
jgi:hypothetical protein